MRFDHLTSQSGPMSASLRFKAPGSTLSDGHCFARALWPCAGAASHSKGSAGHAPRLPAKRSSSSFLVESCIGSSRGFSNARGKTNVQPFRQFHLVLLCMLAPPLPRLQCKCPNRLLSPPSLYSEFGHCRDCKKGGKRLTFRATDRHVLRQVEEKYGRHARRLLHADAAYCHEGAAVLLGEDFTGQMEQDLATNTSGEAFARKQSIASYELYDERAADYHSAVARWKRLHAAMGSATGTPFASLKAQT